MLRWLLLGLLALPAAARDSFYQLTGQIEPGQMAAISIYGATTPFTQQTLSDSSGHFRFQKLQAETYTVAVLVPGRGEARTTVEVGTGTADSKHRVLLTLDLDKMAFAPGSQANGVVSARQLSVPAEAWHEYDEARRSLSRHEGADAETHLRKAVQIAPQFDAAWNNLGTIAYQTGQYERAEQCFRQALAQRPQSYEALVNLGGVLITLHNLSEAENYNQRAVALRPRDALANSQLGITYFEMGNFEPAEKYLEQARDIDPTHFSHPQLVLAEIHSREKKFREAADDLDDFLKHHPDWPQAAQLRSTIARLRQEPG